MINSFILPDAEDDCDRKLLSDIEKYGWHVVVIDADEEGPGFLLTVGLYYTYGHPEILIAGLTREVAYELLFQIEKLIREGKRYENNWIDTDLANFPLAFKAIFFDYYQDYLGYGCWFYRSLPRPFPAVQLVWPDKEGIFPWQRGYNREFIALQPKLYELAPEAEESTLD
jgi:hypothetical protein